MAAWRSTDVPGVLTGQLSSPPEAGFWGDRPFRTHIIECGQEQERGWEGERQNHHPLLFGFFRAKKLGTGLSCGSDSKCRKPGFDSLVEKIPWRREWQLTPVLLPGKFRGQRSLVGYSLWGHKELDMTKHSWQSFYTFKSQNIWEGTFYSFS